jgi:hypothetical protein
VGIATVSAGDICSVWIALFAFAASAIFCCKSLASSCAESAPSPRIARAVDAAPNAALSVVNGGEFDACLSQVVLSLCGAATEAEWETEGEGDGVLFLGIRREVEPVFEFLEFAGGIRCSSCNGKGAGDGVDARDETVEVDGSGESGMRNAEEDAESGRSFVLPEPAPCGRF